MVANLRSVGGVGPKETGTVYPYTVIDKNTPVAVRDTYIVCLEGFGTITVYQGPYTDEELAVSRAPSFRVYIVSLRMTMAVKIGEALVAAPTYTDTLLRIQVPDMGNGGTIPDLTATLTDANMAIARAIQQEQASKIWTPGQ